jgi:hypothetical protein
VTARQRVSLDPDLFERLRDLPKQAGESGIWTDRIDNAVREYLANGTKEWAKVHEEIAYLRAEKQELWTRCQAAAKVIEGPHIAGCQCQFCETVRMLRAAIPDRRHGPTRRIVKP